MPTQELFMRSRNGIVATLIVITVVMYLLPPAYLMVTSFATGAAIADLIWAFPDEYFWYWFPTAGLSSVSAALVYRADKIDKRLLLSIGAAGVWLLFIVNVGIYLQLLLLPGWITFVVLTSIFAYSPFFVLKRLTRSACQFSGSLLEHLAFVASFALPQIYVVFAGMFDPKFFHFYF